MDRGKHFVIWFYQCVIGLLVNTYQTLVKKLLLILEIHRENCEGFLEDYEKDIPDIAAAFGIPEEGLIISKVTGGLSDTQ